MRRRMLASIGGKRGGIPADCVEVEYLESSRSDQFIKTDLEFSTPYRRWVIEESYSNITTRQLWGNSTVGWFFGCSSDGKYEVNSAKSTFIVNKNEKITVDIEFLYATFNIFANLKYTSESATYNNIGYSYPIRSGLCKLFSLGREYSASGKRVYSCRVFDSGNEVLNLIPVRRTTDGLGYMCDTLTGKLFGNAGTGEFIIGPAKTT